MVSPEKFKAGYYAALNPEPQSAQQAEKSPGAHSKSERTLRFMRKSQIRGFNWATVVCSVGLLALLSGCSTGTPSATTTATETATETATTSATSTPTPEAEPVDCTADQLKGSFEMNPIVNIEFQNISDTACIIRGGYPTVEAVDLDGAPVLPEAVQDDSWDVGTQDVTVDPGQSAWAVFAFGYKQQTPDQPTIEIGGFSVTLPESETTLLVPYTSVIWASPDDDNALVIRPISPDREDTTIS